MQGQPLAYANPQHAPMSLADALSHAIGGGAQMSPEALKAMQQEMALRQYDAQMKTQGVSQAFSPRSKADAPPAQKAGAYNPFEFLSGILGGSAQ